MKLAIHQEDGSFSDRWISYCQENNILFKVVNCYDSNIIDQLRDCTALMWHWNQNEYRAMLFAKQLTISLQNTNIRVFPDVNTSWHFDDKLGQKYLFESIKATAVKSYAFYNERDAIKWIETCSFPKVFKLRGGAGSVNVKLINNRLEAKKIINKAFSNGFNPFDKYTRLKDRIFDFKRDRNLKSLKKVFGGFLRLLIKNEIEKFSSKEIGYVYFQDFIKDNSFDTRVIVIGERCFAVRRYVRNNDFRASGSGLIEYRKEFFDERILKMAFEISNKLNSQCAAFDFVLDNNQPKIIEVSYCFLMGKFYDNCNGYWDRDLVWHNKQVNPQYFIIEDFIKTINTPF